MAINLTDPVSPIERGLILAICLATIALVTLFEPRIGSNFPLAGFFFLPLFVAAAYLPRWASFLVAIGTAAAREQYFPQHWDEHAPLRLALSSVAFAGGTLFAGELVRNRRMALALARKIQEEAQARSDAEQQARTLVEGSPAAVLTVDSDGTISMANQAARRLLGFVQGSPEGEKVENYIPVLGRLLKSKGGVRMLGTEVEASGRRRGGEPFYSMIWVSSYGDPSAPRLAAIVSDVTERLRDREESGLRQLLSSSRIIASAVSHEIRNLTGGAGVLHHNLRDVPGMAGNPDYEALGKILDSLLKLSSEELDERDEENLEGVDVVELLQELRLVIEPALEEAGVELEWEVGGKLPAVRAHHSGLLQVFLNLAQNSCRALSGTSRARLRIAAYPLGELTVVSFSDNGPGVASPELLFQPFQAGAESTGLGLFVSRAIIRTFGGELHHTRRGGETRFVIELPSVLSSELVRAQSDSNSVD
ncbi:MAG TPA: ATP-binding protein [Bryobacteraceae bacterium]|nr:ATP-binding protein [Bryobacteraceae bacterium]